MTWCPICVLNKECPASEIRSKFTGYNGKLPCFVYPYKNEKQQQKRIDEVLKTKPWEALV